MTIPGGPQQNHFPEVLSETAENDMAHPIDSPSDSGDDSGKLPPTPAGYFTQPIPVSSPDLAPAPEPRSASASASASESGTKTTARSDSTSVTNAVRHPIRVGTIVWGGVVLVLGILLILSTQLNLDLNPGLTAMWVLLGAGVAMVAGGAVNLLRRAKR